ncbi:5'-3'-deoxyribonucleotidase [Cohnella sp.]|uniref:5' nucleotidase, NT5C type n=1 Tax=Cohnella sp. TaxID=1883426 RepID=UPI0035665D01
MKRIAIDMDEVIADFTSKHIRLFNEKFNESLTLMDIQGSKLREIRPEWTNEILELIRDPLFFRDLIPIKDSQEVIRYLSTQYEIFITTAAMEFPTSFTAKYEWLKEHFDYLDDMNFVFCGDKSIIHADYLIDDNSRHFKNFKGQGILFTASHNVNEIGYDRVDSWLEVKEYFASR